MALPAVAGWLIDFRTAREVFGSGSNQRIDHCVGLCASGNLHICHCEQPLFKDDLPSLRAAFLDDQNCVYVPDDEIMERCLHISSHPLSAKRLKGNDAALFLTATAAENNFGVISDHRSITFTTVFDLCNQFGVPVMSADDYFDEAL